MPRVRLNWNRSFKKIIYARMPDFGFGIRAYFDGAKLAFMREWSATV
ncbi:MAG TPA: hypothetical protein IAB97_07085 [Candidatus Choladousia intestinipullorum]|nr:hypothetical protein [Candidatus Choladousia intestinipullorum]